MPSLAHSHQNAQGKEYYEKLQKCSDFAWEGMAERMKQQRNPITGVTFSYVGTDSDFETFLKILVRDYLSADDPAANPETDSVQKVDSEVA